MKHRVVTRTLGRQTAHRLAMLGNMARSLLQHDRITTTETRAKELSKYIDELVTWALKAHGASDNTAKLAAKREVFRRIPGAPRAKSGASSGGGASRPDRDVAQKLFEQIAPRFAPGNDLARKSGFTRIIRLYPRKGDGAPMALIELIEPDAK